MQFCHTPAALSAVFDEPNLIACAGLVPSVALADRIGLRDLADEWLTVPGSRGTAGVKVMSLVAGMLAGADSSAMIVALVQPRAARVASIHSVVTRVVGQPVPVQS